MSMRVWSSDPDINRSIEHQRTNLSIKYLRKFNSWLENHRSEDNPTLYDAFEKARNVLSGAHPKVTKSLLDGLEFMAKKHLDKKPKFIDLTNDDDDDELIVVRKDVSVISILDSPPHSPPHVDSEEVADVDLRFQLPVRSEIPATTAQNSRSPVVVRPEPPVELPEPPVELPEPPVELPVPPVELPVSPVELRVPPPVSQLPLDITPVSVEIPSVSSELPIAPAIPESSPPSCLYSPVSENSSHRPLPPRRKSLGSIAKEQPSIADYKLKRKVLKPSGIYAKPIEQVSKPRQIISVPYKTAPRPPVAPMDPKEQAIKLAGITERIYAKNYLHIEEEKKEEMRKEREKEAKMNEKVQAPIGKSRRKSVASKSEVQPSARIVTRRKSVCEKKAVEPPAVKTARKRTARRIESDFEDDDYEVPDHVFEGIKEDAVAVQKKVEEDRAKEISSKKRRISTSVKENEAKSSWKPPETSTHYQASSSSSSESIGTPIETALSLRRMTRSKSMLLSPSKANSIDESFGIIVADTPVKKPPAKPLVVSPAKPPPVPSVKPPVKVEPPPKTPSKAPAKPKKGRGRPRKKNMPEVTREELLSVPPDAIFSPPKYFDDPIDENMLIEVPGKLKQLKRKTVLKPRKERRAEIDEAPVIMLPMDIKEEPVDQPQED